MDWWEKYIKDKKIAQSVNILILNRKYMYSSP